MKRQVLIFSNRKVSSAPRILREIEALKDHFGIHLTGEEAVFQTEHAYSCIYDFRSTADKLKSKSAQWLKQVERSPSYSRIGKYIRENNISLVIFHEPNFLSLALALKKKYGVKIIFNAHEYHPQEFEDLPGWLETEGIYFTELYRSCLPQFDLVINVCESIRLKCLEEFKADSIVIPNAASLKELSVQSNTGFPVRMIHHGVNLPSRKVENMIEIAARLGANYSLDLMLTSVNGNESYDEAIRKKIAETPNVSWKKPVAIHQICSEINPYDIGLFYLEPTNFNYRYALPNKLFEFIQARLAIAISPSPEMKNLVQKYELGVCADDFSINSMVEKISALSREAIQRFKQNSDQAAHLENTEKYNAVYLAKILSLFHN
ncbi:glycosyltransferase [Fluviicola sp.]|uniref:glycosyltransferase n=1 Tax=Fluviicola sp. TaxID=1917219 RepID=UPI0031DBCA17